MLFWTHLLVGLFGILVYLPYSENKVIFFVVALAASVLADIDSPTSKLGRKFSSRVLFAFSKHRGFLHSLTFMFLVYLILKFTLPIFAFPFLFGYSIHLFLDIFTVQGIKLFWPFKFRLRGFVKSGKLIELFLMILFLILDCFMFVVRII